MSKKTTERGELVKQYMLDNPDMKSYTLSQRIFLEHPHLFDSVDQVRGVIRYHNGSKGKMNRVKLTDKSLVKPLTYDTSNAFVGFKSHAPTLQTFSLPTSIKEVLFITDIHLPYHDEKWLSCIIKYGKETNVDCIWINGDLMDMFQASVHEKLPGKKDLKFEFDFTRDFFARLRAIFPTQTIYYYEGNHEMRWERYLMRKAVEVLGMDEFRLDIILRLREFKVEWIRNGTLCNFGKIYVIHGNEFKGGGGVYPARALMLKAFENIIAGDKHKTGEEPKNLIGGKFITAFSVGCGCDLNPEYMPYAHVIWNHGFAHISMLKNGHFKTRNYRVKNGEIL